MLDGDARRSRAYADSARAGYDFQQLARIYIMTGEPEQAISQLETILKIPYLLLPAWLRVDPTFDPLRTHPRFRRLVEGPK